MVWTLILFVFSICLDVVAISFLFVALKLAFDAKLTYKEAKDNYKEAQGLLDKASLLAGIASPDHPKYEVKDLVAHDKLKEFAGILKARLPDGYTYSLFIMGKDPQATAYLSSANRDDMVKCLHEFIEDHEKGNPSTCAVCKCPAVAWPKNPNGKGYVTPPKV